MPRSPDPAPARDSSLTKNRALLFSARLVARPFVNPNPVDVITCTAREIDDPAKANRATVRRWDREAASNIGGRKVPPGVDGDAREEDQIGHDVAIARDGPGQTGAAGE